MLHQSEEGGLALHMGSDQIGIIVVLIEAVLLGNDLSG